MFGAEYAQQIERHKENYLMFLKYPEGIRKHIEHSRVSTFRNRVNETRTWGIFSLLQDVGDEFIYSTYEFT